MAIQSLEARRPQHRLWLRLTELRWLEAVLGREAIVCHVTFYQDGDKTCDLVFSQALGWL